jgi:hypothetical protein
MREQPGARFVGVPHAATAVLAGVGRRLAYRRRALALALAPLGLRLAGCACVSALALAGGANADRAATYAPPECTRTQLKLRGQLSGATQSLLGTLTLANTSGRACALPAAPRRVSIVIGSQVLPVLTVRMHGSQVPPGVSTRRLPMYGQVRLGLQWRNWCGAPRGLVRLSLRLTLFRATTIRTTLGRLSTPPCVDNKHSSTIAVSRFLKNGP